MCEVVVDSYYFFFLNGHGGLYGAVFFFESLKSVFELFYDFEVFWKFLFQRPWDCNRVYVFVWIAKA